jgi:shikimate dehydrogenase
MICKLIGEHLSHSYSKLIHEAFGLYGYELAPLAPDALGDFLKNGEYHGLNVTIPYKKAVIPYCAELSETARAIGSVNTILRRPDGSLYGHNTDFGGFLALADRAGIAFEGKKVLIFGSGGTSLTAQAAARARGAREIVVVSRKGPVTYDSLGAHEDSEILIQTTPVGMYPHNADTLVDVGRFGRCEGVLDVIYNPLRTRLVREARARNIPASGGLFMLVAQAKEAAELFCGHEISEEITEEVYRTLLRRVANVVLVGMPGSGKTTVGKAVAKRLGREFFDVDELIETAEGMPIAQIFAQFGEAHFRKLEADCVAQCAVRSGVVIAPGGGAILNKESTALLSQNGRVYWILRDISKLDTSLRPLSKDRAALEEMYVRRSPL